MITFGPSYDKHLAAEPVRMIIRAFRRDDRWRSNTWTVSGGERAFQLINSPSATEVGGFQRHHPAGRAVSGQ
jgi:hypothetical protein